MPFPGQVPLGGNGDILADLVRRVELVEAKLRDLHDGAIIATDSNGVVRLVVGKVSSTAWGAQFFDADGLLRAALGGLANGDYGLEVLDNANPQNSQEILPAVQQYIAGNISVTSTTYVQDGGPAVTAIVGASGSVKVEASSFASSNTASDGAWVGLAVDGAVVQDLLELDSAGGQVTTDWATSVILTGLTPGSHTFELYYKHSTGANPADFSRRSLIVTPR